MLIEQLNVFDFRNIKSASLDTNAQVNVFFGENGSGKTSILEALYFISRAKSFRTSKRNDLIKTSEKQLIVSSVIAQPKDKHKAGISLDEKGITQLKLDGVNTSRLSTVSSIVPTQLITPESFDVFWSSPKARRSFFDFGLFHVEHNFQKTWLTFSKTLKQINVLLKQKASDQELSYWYKGLISSSEKIDEMRNVFLSNLFDQEMKAVINALAETDNKILNNIDVRYKSKPVVNINGDYSKQIEKDKKYKQVSFGPNRADIAFYKDGEDITSKLSRGQAKKLFYFLEVVMVNVIRKVTNKNVALLVDDLPSEVDFNARQIMLEMLLLSKAQIFVTGIENKIAMEFKKYTDSVNVFHVEHGNVRTENMEQLCP